MTEEQARKQAHSEKEFYGHLATYLVVISGLVAINLLTSPDTIWFIWPLLGWGVGLLGHASETFGIPFASAWEEKRIRELRSEEVTDARIRSMLSEELDARVPAGPPQDTARLQRRIEHLEAIVTSRDWDALEADFRAEPGPSATEAPGVGERSSRPPLQEQVNQMMEDESGRESFHSGESAETRAARIARRVE